MSKINVYYGVSSDAPQNIDNLKCKQVAVDELLANGLSLKMVTKDEYTVIALDKKSDLKLAAIKYSGFAIEVLTVKNSDYYIYYGEEPSTDTATITCEFKRVKKV